MAFASSSEDEEDFSKALDSADTEPCHTQPTLHTTSGATSNTLPAHCHTQPTLHTTSGATSNTLPAQCHTQPTLHTTSGATSNTLPAHSYESARDEQTRSIESTALSATGTWPSSQTTSLEASPPLQNQADSNGVKITKEDGSKKISPSPPMSRIGLNSHKAGMDGLDKAKINQVILEASKGSKYYENEVKKEKQVTIKIDKMFEALSRISPTQKSAALIAADESMGTLEMSRDLSHIIVHVDMDAFYAAVEVKDDPSLRDVPMAVGSSHMLSTSNYVARRYGVRAAMPGFIAKKLCPDLVIVRTHFDRYREVSQQVQEVLSRYDPAFCPVGLDESYLDITELVVKKLTKSEEEERTRQLKQSGSASMERGKNSREEIVREGTTETASDGSCRLQPDARNDSCRNVSEHDLECSYELMPAGGSANTLMEGTTGRHTSLPSTTSSEAVSTNSLHSTTSSEAVSTNSLHSTTSSEADSTNSLHSTTSSEADSTNRKVLSLPYWECARAVVAELRASVHRKTGLTASAGIAPNKMLAKIASDINKPNGQYFVTPTREGVIGFIQQLSIRKICGIGKVTERMLNALGVVTCRDLYDKRDILQLVFSSTSSHYFHSICLGISSSQVHREYERKSISTERTFSEISDADELQRKCYELCQALAKDMQGEGVKGRTVTVKLKTVHFDVKSHASTLAQPVCTAEQIYQAASQLLKTEINSCSPSPLRLRLMGVRVSSLQSEVKSKKEKPTGFFTSPKKDHDSNEATTIIAASSNPLSIPVQTKSCVCDLEVPQSSSSSLGLETAPFKVEACVTSLKSLTPSMLQSSENTSTGECSELQLVTAACPVCGDRVASVDNVSFNKHIDECLNRPAIKEAMKAASSSPIVTPTKKTVVAESCPSKKSSPWPKLSSRKRKASSIAGVLGSGDKASPNKRITLNHFWNSK